MKLVLNRDNASTAATMGQMWLEGQLAAYTLELPMKDGKPGSAIPAGTYRIGIYPSPHFGRLMPLLEGIPGRSEIEIHWGNDVVDTRGCILVGEQRDLSTHEIFNTRKKFEELFPAIQAASEAEGCWIEVNDPLSNNVEDVETAANGD